MIPLVIVDATERPDLTEFIRLHQHTDPGDVVVQWGRLSGRKDTVALVLRFVRPAELVAVVEFEFARNHPILVEQVLTSKVLYLQAGRPGDCFSNSPDAPRIMLEVPDTGFGPAWEVLHFDWVFRRCKKHGLSRRKAEQEARATIAAIKEISAIRMPSGE